MDFELNRTQKDIQKAVRDFVKGEFDRELAGELEQRREFPFRVWKMACELGLIGIHFPEKYSGQGLGFLEDILVIEELCRGDSSIGSAIALSSFTSEIIMHHGSDEQKASYLPAVAGGKMLSAGAFSEPGQGGDVSSMKTSAKRDGAEWVINGRKSFIMNGGLAGFYSVLCQTGPKANPGHEGQSIILVEANREGLSIADVGPKMGIRSLSTADLSFKDVRVPLANLIGEENKGYYYVARFFNESHTQLSAHSLGMAQGSYALALEYAKKREQFGKKIAEFQVTMHKLADMATKIELARLITYKSAWNIDQGCMDPKLSSMAKIYTTRVAVEVCDEAIQLHGGYGYMNEYTVERFYRDAKVAEVHDGTNEIQRDRIGSALIGKLK